MVGYVSDYYGDKEAIEWDFHYRWVSGKFRNCGYV
jgi:hypothetical protein